MNRKIRFSMVLVLGCFLAGQASPRCHSITVPVQETVFTVNDTIVETIESGNYDWTTAVLPANLPDTTEAVYLEILNCREAGSLIGGDNHWISVKSGSPNSERECRFVAVGGEDCNQCFVWLPVGEDLTFQHEFQGYDSQSSRFIKMSLRGYMYRTTATGVLGM